MRTWPALRGSLKSNVFRMHDEGNNNCTGYLCTKLSANSKKNLKQFLDSLAGSNRANVILADTLTPLLFEVIPSPVW